MSASLALAGLLHAEAGAAPAAAAEPATAPPAAAAPGAQAEPPQCLLVAVEPPRIELGRRAVFTAALLREVLALRLGATRLEVVERAEACPAGHGGMWTLQLRQLGKIASVTLDAPEGQAVVKRQVPLRSLRPHDLAQIVTLSTLEGLASWSDRYAHLLPERMSVEPPAPLRPAPPPPPAQVRAALAPPPPPRHLWWRAGAQVGGALSLPGERFNGTAGARLVATGRLFLGTLDLTLGLPQSAEGEGYRLDLVGGHAYLGLGIKRSWQGLDLGLDLGPALLLSRASTRGENIAEIDEIIVNLGLGARGSVFMPLGDHLGVELALAGRRLFTYERFFLGDRIIFNMGSTCLTLTAALLYTL